MDARTATGLELRLCDRRYAAKDLGCDDVIEVTKNGKTVKFLIMEKGEPQAAGGNYSRYHGWYTMYGEFLDGPDAGYCGFATVNTRGTRKVWVLFG